MTEAKVVEFQSPCKIIDVSPYVKIRITTQKPLLGATITFRVKRKNGEGTEPYECTDGKHVTSIHLNLLEWLKFTEVFRPFAGYVRMVHDELALGGNPAMPETYRVISNTLLIANVRQPQHEGMVTALLPYILPKSDLGNLAWKRGICFNVVESAKFVHLLPAIGKSLSLYTWSGGLASVLFCKKRPKLVHSIFITHYRSTSCDGDSFYETDGSGHTNGCR